MLTKTVISACKEKLLTIKFELLNRVRSEFQNLREREVGGDEADQAVSMLAESRSFFTQMRLRSQLVEIESALARIDAGTYGTCEETDELIEPERLLALPWTRLSFEGAEIRETAAARRG